ncbi:Dermonecrotoxin of the Papain-like fold [Pseudomonas sp. LAMO17WK12:I10]|uniref:hypothetical protein n=1 Tax=unclassified Pseudomonas TaxID=196821 RepID=UPI000BC95BB4|nr:MULTISPECIES: hypothetical protein [unclassified Pseudomonas]PXX50352.1 papain fold dermonecrotoxin of polymorphic toxin system [Pseudomonas sp. LAMO17WK12:I9]SNY54041.1 Dermonecrotoxin of the Papain-like fold [Pseudomonas sp. LAMO17WK12:I10]
MLRTYEERKNTHTTSSIKSEKEKDYPSEYEDMEYAATKKYTFKDLAKNASGKRLDWLDLAQALPAQNTTKAQYNSIESIADKYNLLTGGMDTNFQSIKQGRQKIQGAKTDKERTRPILKIGDTPDNTKQPSAYPWNNVETSVIDDIVNDSSVASYSKKPRNMCLACAQRVTEILDKRNVTYQVMGILTWSGINDTRPANHYAVVASIDEQKFIIDPTAGQFGNSQAFYGGLDQWSTQLKENLPHRLIKVREFRTLSQATAKIGTIWADPMDFEGSILQDTSWHQRILKNSVAFRAQQQRDIRANFGAPPPSRGFMGAISSCFGRR